MENHQIESMFEREALQKKQDYDRLKIEINDANMMKEQAQFELNQAKVKFHDK